MRPVVWNLLALAAGIGGCSFEESGPRYDSGLEGLDIVSVQPSVLVPGTVISIEGRSLVDAPWGKTELHLAGRYSDGGQARDVDFRVPARFVDFEHLEIVVDEALVAQLGVREGEFAGTVTIEVDSTVDRQLHTSGALDVRLALRTELTPELDEIELSPDIYVNDEILVTGANMLLGGAEGITYARVEGCFAPAGDGGEPGECVPVEPADLSVTPAERFDRSSGRFRFAPEIAGILAGEFRGQVLLRNVHGPGRDDALVRESGTAAAEVRLVETEVRDVTPSRISLGQYLQVEGGGFVGGADDQLTLLHLTGQYTQEDAPGPIDIDTVLVPEFVAGRTVRYVMNEDDDLGTVLGLRGGGGTFTGTITPIVSFRDQEVTGEARAFNLRMAPVAQVVHLNFTAQYVSSLQHFGLRAADAQIRQRVIDVVARDYLTVNVELRTEPPVDFSLYAEVEVGGPDPNGLGLLGYDNTPGKDVGNLRLHDRIGGVNATTQADGFPGYGGVFVESLFIFSEHPAGFAPESPGQDPLFDEIFDPFRVDQDGEAVVAAEVAGMDALDSGTACPASDRKGRIACAVWVLGSLIGTTVSHELGHSLGLANPAGGDVHILNDRPNRLMEAGGGRSFLERAELGGEGPGMFCDQEYTYLRTILPVDEPEDPSARPDCF
jgi:hypothetical protein